jgi:hypothetical protein
MLVSRPGIMSSPDDTVEAKANKALVERVTRVRVAVDEALATLAAPLRVASAFEQAGDDAVDLRPFLRFLTAARTAGSQRDVLSALLDVASTCYARTVLFIARSGALVAWQARNIETAQEAGTRKVLHLTIPARGDHLAARAVSSGAVVAAGSEGPGFLLTGALGGFVPARSAAVPLVVRGRAVAVLYGDCGASSGSGTESLFELIGPLGGLCIEALGSRRGRAADIHRGEAQVPAGRGAEARHDLAVGALAGRGRRSPAPEGPAAGLDDLEPRPEPGFSATAPQAPEEAEMQALLGEIDGMRREPGDAPLGPEERRADADAHRLASLLISELLLYNEEAVILGRRNRDLSIRLAREIEKSRQAYAARVPGTLPGAGRYFDDELVRVLAEGDPSVLGG